MLRRHTSCRLFSRTSHGLLCPPLLLQLWAELPLLLLQRRGPCILERPDWCLQG